MVRCCLWVGVGLSCDIFLAKREGGEEDDGETKTKKLHGHVFFRFYLAKANGGGQWWLVPTHTHTHTYGGNNDHATHGGHGVLLWFCKRNTCLISDQTKITQNMVILTNEKKNMNEKLNETKRKQR